MKKTTFIAFTLAIWVIAVFSLIAVRYLIQKTPKVSDFSRSAQAYFKDLDPDTKRNISVLETAIIRLKDGAISIIGTGFERELENLLLERQLSIRKIDFFIENPVVIERRMMAGEAFKTLNNAEKKCFIDGFGAIIFRNGSYHLIYDETVYQDYIKEYGTECKPCEDLKKLGNAQQGVSNEQ